MADKTKYFDYDTVKEMLYDLEYEGKDVEPSDYPYIEIVDEHGDLIDRQKFYEKIVQHIKDTESEDFTDKEREMVQMAMKAVLYELLNECAVVLERTT